MGGSVSLFTKLQSPRSKLTFCRSEYLLCIEEGAGPSLCWRWEVGVGDNIQSQLTAHIRSDQITAHIITIIYTSTHLTLAEESWVSGGHTGFFEDCEKRTGRLDLAALRRAGSQQLFSFVDWPLAQTEPRSVPVLK